MRKGTKLSDQLRSQVSAIDADWLAFSDEALMLGKQVLAANLAFLLPDRTGIRVYPGLTILVTV